MQCSPTSMHCILSKLHAAAAIFCASGVGCQLINRPLTLPEQCCSILTYVCIRHTARRAVQTAPSAALHLMGTRLRFKQTLQTLQHPGTPVLSGGPPRAPTQHQGHATAEG